MKREKRFPPGTSLYTTPKSRIKTLLFNNIVKMQIAAAPVAMAFAPVCVAQAKAHRMSAPQGVAAPHFAAKPLKTARRMGAKAINGTFT